MTENMRATLAEAGRHQEGLRRLHDDQARWPAHPSTLAALVRRGWLTRDQGTTRRGLKVDIWRITDDGRQALNPPPRTYQERPLYLARGSLRFKIGANNRWEVDETGSAGDYTSDPRRSIDRVSHPVTGRQTAVEVAVAPVDLERFAQKARDREQERKREHGRTLDKHPAGERLERLRPVARERHMDLNGERRLVRHMLATGREDDALARITRLEEQLGQRAA